MMMKISDNYINFFDATSVKAILRTGEKDFFNPWGGGGIK